MSGETKRHTQRVGFSLSTKWLQTMTGKTCEGLFQRRRYCATRPSCRLPSLSVLFEKGEAFPP